MKKKNILIIANLTHSFPRIPGIAYALQKQNWKITIVTPYLKDKDFDKFSLPKDFKKSVKIIFTASYPDIYDKIRKIMCLLRLVKPNTRNNFTSELIKKTSLNNLIPSKFYSFLHSLFQSIFGYPDTEKNWFKIAVPILNTLCKKQKFSLLISSSPYPICHILAENLVHKFKLKWVADFRDPWSQNHNYKMFFWRKILDRNLEIKTIKKAHLITTPSKGFKEKLQSIHNSEIKIVPNGYLPSKKIVYNSNNKYLNLVYTGRLYENKQNVDPLLNSIKKFNYLYPESSGNITLNFYGPFSTYLESKIKKLKIEKFVKQNKSVSRSEVFKIHQEATALILFNWNENEKGILPLKFYEYLNSKRLILTIGKDYSGEINYILKKTKTGYNLINEMDILKKLIVLNDKISKNKDVNSKFNDNEISKYSIYTSGIKLSKILNRLNNAKL